MMRLRAAAPRVSSAPQLKGWAPSSSSRLGGGWTPVSPGSSPAAACTPCPQGRRWASTDSQGHQTFGAVVRHLRREGKLPTGATPAPESQAPAWTQDGFVDIDAELACGVSDGESDGEDEGNLDGSGDELDDASAPRDDAHMRLSASGSKKDVYEDVSDLTEDQMREKVRKSIEELVPDDVGDVGDENDHSPRDRGAMTPAQVFYMENRGRLVARAQEYYLEKQRELKAIKEQGSDMDVEDEWRYYRDPVVRPPRGHLWSTGEEVGQTEDLGTEHGSELDWRKFVSEWPQGELPTVEMLAELLRSEQARDVEIIDLGACERRDLGTHAIIATGVTAQHCRRLGEIAAKACEERMVRHIEAFCYGTRRDEWIVANCGPIKVHIFTRDTREEYDLKLLWEQPENFFVEGDFPHYIEIYGQAANAIFLPDGNHITTPTGGRRAGWIPAPYQDKINDLLVGTDYDAAEDAHYIATSRDVDFSTTDSPSSQHAAPKAGSASSRPRPNPEEDPFRDDDLDIDGESDTDNEDAVEVPPDGVAVELQSAGGTRVGGATGAPAVNRGGPEQSADDDHLESWPYGENAGANAKSSPKAEADDWPESQGSPAGRKSSGRGRGGAGGESSGLDQL